MNDEAYPMEPDWQFIASPNHDGKMQYFKFDDLLKTPLASQKPVVTDSFNEFYHSVARTSANSMRVMTWSSMQFKDFQIGQQKNQTTLTGGDTKRACQNLMGANFNYPEYIALKEDVERQFNAMLACSERMHRENPARTAADYDICKTHLEPGFEEKMKRFEEMQKPVDDTLENPILSKDGSEVGALNNGKMTIFGLNANGDCSIKEQFNYRGSKMNFSYPVPGKKGKVAFTSVNNAYDTAQSLKTQVYVYDRDRKKQYLVGENTSAHSYPGFTQDGNLMYLTSDYRNGVQEYRVAIADLKNFDFDHCGDATAPAAQ